jgi:integrase/recombinase XerD
MTDETLGPWIRRFLLEHVVAERNLARNTQHGYRDAFRQLIPFVARLSRRSVDRLHVVDISADRVRLFLTDIEVSRHCTIATRNQRLAAIRAFAGFVGEHSPVHIEWSGQIRSIPFKKTGKAVVPYLEKPEIDALLASPDRRTAQGRRDHALLLFLYNTGARASEAAQVKIVDLNLGSASVKITGKGGKQRSCPLWPVTVSELAALIGESDPSRPVFLNRRGIPITRFGIHTVVERNALKALARSPSLAMKRVVLIPSATPAQPIFCALALKSTQSGVGSVMYRWRQQISMPRSTSTPKPKHWRNATCLTSKRSPGAGGISPR